MKFYLVIILLFATTSFAAKTETKELWNIMNKRYEITSSILLMTPATFPKEKRPEIKNFIQKSKTELESKIENKFEATLETEFKPEEIAYLRQIYSHSLLERYDLFVRGFADKYGLPITQDAVSKMKPTK